MKQTLILLAGYPGTGKSYLAELLMKQFTGFEILSPDEIKEARYTILSSISPLFTASSSNSPNVASRLTDSSMLSGFS